MWRQRSNASSFSPSTETLTRRWYDLLLFHDNPPIWIVERRAFGGTSSQGNAINDQGQVIGEATTNGIANPIAFLYTGGGMTNLRTLAGSSSIAWGINSLGQVTGSADVATSSGAPTGHAFLYSCGSMIDLSAPHRVTGVTILTTRLRMAREGSPAACLKTMNILVS